MSGHFSQEKDETGVPTDVLIQKGLRLP